MGPQNYGDAARQVMARGRFVVKELGTDLRVLDHYQRWLVERNLPQLNQRMQETATATWIDAGPMLDAIWRDPTDGELDALARLLRDDLGLRFRQEDPYPWAVQALIVVFQTAAHNDIAPPDPEHQLSVKAKLEGLSGIPPGRFPRHEGQDIARDVAWVYRALIKHPADSIHELATEWAEQEKRVTDARSVVQNSIDRGIQWLGLALARPETSK